MLRPKAMPRFDPGSTTGSHHAIRRIWLSEFWARAAGRRRAQRTDRAPARALRHRRLSHRRHHHRPVWACGVWHARKHHPGFRAWCRDVLFLIGLELELGRLLAMRRAIFGLGAAQLALTALAIGALGYAAGLVDWRGAVIVGLALAMSATAIALQILEERGQLQQDYGQRAFAILLFQDMAVVPLLAMLPLLAPGSESTHTGLGDGVRTVALIAGAIALIVVAGRYLLNPFFRLLAQTGSREVMTAAALLVVLGAALTMQKAGMSMALGAFLAGVLLAESNYRHELAADIEPFRGLLLALFFMGIGMSIDLTIVRANLWLIVLAAVTITVLKAAIVWLLFRATCVRRSDALRAGSVLTGAGEFAFVLIPLGGSLGVLDARQASILTAIAAITMLLGPAVATLTDTLLRRFARPDLREPEDFSDAS